MKPRVSYGPYVDDAEKTSLPKVWTAVVRTYKIPNPVKFALLVSEFMEN